MNRSELISRLVILAGLILAIGAPLFFWSRTPLIHAQMAEHGGWTPDVIRAEVGQPLHLKFTSEDVVHGFAVGQMDADGAEAVDIEPGKVTDITLTFDTPGTYTFYCTRWCGVNHWRMRGTIEVTGGSNPAPPPAIPLYITLGIDIDAPHDAPSIPPDTPSAIRGGALVDQVALDLTVDDYQSQSPYQVFDGIADTSFTELERWDMVAYLWQSNTTKASLQNGRELYTQNCAACHGENGAGDGVFADDLAQTGAASMQTMNGSMDMAMQAPVDFTDPKRILGASPALLHGKILRGGMGTGMPMWGSIFTTEEIGDLVAYLYSFQFNYQGEIQ